MQTHTPKFTVRAAVASLAACGLAFAGGTPVALAVQDYQDLTTANQMVSEPENVPVSTIDPQLAIQSFNDGWKFVMGDQGAAQNPDFDDSKWKNVTLPHDYSIDQPFTKAGEGESGYLLGGLGWYRKSVLIPQELAGKRININFDGIYMDATIYVNGQQLANHPYGYTPFSVDITDAVQPGENAVIAVKVNHQIPSSRWYSGSGIYRDVDLVITDPVHVAYNGVQIVPQGIDTYKGSGTLNVAVTATVANESAADAAVTVKQTIKAVKDGAQIGTSTSPATTIAAGKTAAVQVQVPAAAPKLWSLTDPNLYTVTTEVLKDGKVVDTVNSRTGFRSIKFDANNGFSLNGTAMKLKGVSMHHDQGALGARAYRDAIARQIDILQEMGANAIRVTHNPASRDLIELADQKGMLIIEEFFDGWHCAKNGNSNDYARFFNQSVPTGTKLENVTPGSTWPQFDIETTIRRGINSPSIISWSLGNEINEGTSCVINSYASEQKNLVKWAVALDKTRPVTRGDNKIQNTPADAMGVMNGLVTSAKSEGSYAIVGANYADNRKYDNIHRQHPEWLLYGSETASSVNSRGVYDRTSDDTKTRDKQLTSYDGSKVGWGAYASEAWYDVITRDYVAGTFVWTGFDYIGEPTHWNNTSTWNLASSGAWPSPKNSYFGIIDTAGFPKDSYYFYRSQWNDAKHTLHILPAWNSDILGKQAGENVKVVVYSDAPTVKLYFTPKGSDARQLIGEKSFTTKQSAGGKYSYQIYEGEGKSPTTYENLYLSWQVPYADGTLTAEAYDANGQQITDTAGRSQVSTAGVAKKLEAKVNRTKATANNEDLAYVEVAVRDADGNLVPSANNEVKFTVSGAGELMGTDAGEQADHTPYASPTHKAYHGQVLGIVKTTKKNGTITVTASAEGLESSTVTITATGGADNVLDHYQYPRNYYVKVGTQPKLPSVINAFYADGTSKDVAVTWNKIPAEKIAKEGTFTVNGKTGEGDTITASVTMLDKVGVVLNYSAVTPKGQTPTLPSSRPAVLPDGTVLSTQFPVQWEAPAADAYSKAGMVKVTGKATVFGQEYPVTATIRVAESTTTIGDNVAPQVKELEQDIPADMQSDTLSAIIDGKTPNVAGSPNKTIWSNYKNTKDGQDTEAEITFSFATQEIFGEFMVYFARDSWSTTYPAPGDTEFYVSDTKSADPNDWTRVKVTETAGAEEGNSQGWVKPYTYKLAAPTPGTYVKLKVKNNPSADGLNAGFSCTGISEVLLKRAVTTGASANTTAAFESLKVNGEAVAQHFLDAWAYQTPKQSVDMATLEAITKDNAAVTILPEYQKVVRLIVESEDHNTMKTFEIQLGKEPILPADEDKLDVDRTKMQIVVGNQQDNSSNGKQNAIDGDNGSIWHTAWGNGNLIKGDKDKLAAHGWAVLILEDPADLQGLRYLPRPDNGDSGDNNGTIGEYEVYVSDTAAPAGATVDGVKLPADDQYVKVASGTWPDDHAWKLAQFNNPVTAKYVKLVPKATYGAGGTNSFVSAAELRVRKATMPVAPVTPTLAKVADVPDAVVGTEITPIAIKAEHATNVAVAGLPQGLTFDAGKLTVSGTPAESGSFPVTVTAKGVAGTKPASVKFTITVKPKPVAPTVAKVADVPDAVVGTAIAPITIHAEHAVSVAVAGLPQGLTFDAGKLTVSGTPAESGSFSVTVTAKGAEGTKPASVKFTITVKPDTEALQAAVDAAGKLPQADYTADSWQAFAKALADAKRVLKDPKDQAQVNDALGVLQKAQKALQKKPVVPKPQVVVLVAPRAVDPGDCVTLAYVTVTPVAGVKYTVTDGAGNVVRPSADDANRFVYQKSVLQAASVTVRAEVTDAAKYVFADGAQTEWSWSAKARDCQPDKPVKPDTEALQAAVKDAVALRQADYTVDSWQAFAKALADAKRVLKDPQDQAQVNEALSVLQEAQQALQKKPVEPVKPDTEALQAAVKDAVALRQADYTVDSWRAFAKALADAKRVLKDPQDQAAVNDALSALQDAQKALKKAEQPVTPTPDNPTPDQPDNPKPVKPGKSDVQRTPDTGASLAWMVFASLGLLSVGGVLAARRRNA